jgi:hypothetical protein
MTADEVGGKQKYTFADFAVPSFDFLSHKQASFKRISPSTTEEKVTAPPTSVPSGHCPFYRLFRSPATLAPAQLPRPLILEARNTTSPCPSVFTSHTRAQKCLRQSVGLCSSSMTSDSPARPSVMELQLQSHFYLERALTCSIYQCRSFQWKKRSKSHVKRLQRRLRMSKILRIMERVLHPLRSLILDGLFLQRDHFH